MITSEEAHRAVCLGIRNAARTNHTPTMIVTGHSANRALWCVVDAHRRWEFRRKDEHRWDIYMGLRVIESGDVPEDHVEVLSGPT